MSRRNRILVPEAKKGMEKLKIEAARELAANNNNPDSVNNFSVGGRMVKKMVEKYEKKLK
ncbi:small, acid-soluble spore protein, alpha/beta type [Clostridium sp. Mt-5]|uniref:Small, acid-soluble spore protein, alpha/beta type n=1 Tax=Clostridium moutaii TaxID=3240932 RepID=A0ABV4BN52_9CLOT